MNNTFVDSMEGEYGMDIPDDEWISRPHTKGLERQRNSRFEYKKREWVEYSVEFEDDREILKEIIREENTIKPIRNRKHNRQHNKYAKSNYHAPRNNKQFNHRRR